MLQWLSVSLNSVNSVKVMLHLGKTPMNVSNISSGKVAKFVHLLFFLIDVILDCLWII